MKSKHNPLSKQQWLEWIDEEQQGRMEHWGYDSIQQIKDYWLPNPDHEPIVCAYTPDGSIEVWDGFHRFGISVKENLSQVPLLLGTIKAPSVSEIEA